MKIAMFWSNNSYLYEILTGGDEMKGKVYVKLNCPEVQQICTQLNISKPLNWDQGFLAASENYDAFCGLVDTTPDTLNQITQHFQKTINYYSSS